MLCMFSAVITAISIMWGQAEATGWSRKPVGAPRSGLNAIPTARSLSPIDPEAMEKKLAELSTYPQLTEEELTRVDSAIMGNSLFHNAVWEVIDQNLDTPPYLLYDLCTQAVGPGPALSRFPQNLRPHIELHIARFGLLHCMRNGNLDKASDYVTYILYLLNLNKMSAEYIHRYPQMLTLLFIMIQQTSISERNLGEHPEDFIPVSAFPSVTAELMGLLMTTWPEYFDSARVFNNYSVMHFDKAARREAQASAKYPACQAAMLLAYDAELDLFNRRLAERLGNTQIQDCCAVDRGGTDREFKSSCALLAPVSQQLSASSYRVELSRRYDPSNSIGPCKGFLFDGALNDQLSPFAAHYSRNNTVELFHPQNRVNGMFGFGQKKFTGTGVVQEYVPGGRIAAVSPFFELRFFTLGAKEHFISVVLPNAPKQLKFNPRWAARMQNLPPEATADGPSLQRLATRARPTQSPSGVLRKQSVQASTGVSRPPPSGQRTKTPSVLGGPAPLPSTGVSRAPPSGQRTNTPSVLSKPDPELDRFLEVHATSGRRLPPPKDSNPPTHPRRTSRQTEKEYPPSRSTPRQPDPIDRRKVSRQPAPEFPRHVPAGSVRSPKPSLKPSSDEQRIVVYYKGNPNKTLTGMPIEVMQDQVLLLNSSITPGDNNYYTVEVDGDVYRWEDFMLNLFP